MIAPPSLPSKPPTTILLAAAPAQSGDKSLAGLFDGIPAARTLAESHQGLAARQQAALRAWQDAPLEDWLGWRYEAALGRPEPGATAKIEIPNRANALLLAGQQIARVNRVLLSGTPYSHPGTHSVPIARLSEHLAHNGDYDFTLLGLTTLLWRNLDNPALWPETQKHLSTVLLNEEGNEHLASRWLSGLVPETENHILMTETSRYLKNQLVQARGLSWSTHRLPPAAYDNRANGFNDWFIRHLSGYVKEDFGEYNSRPYQGYTVKAILNLAEFASDADVRISARIVLDYLAARFATQSSELRRMVPFRRRWGYQRADNVLLNDTESARFAILVGNYAGAFRDAAQPMPFSRHNLLAGTGSYRVPDAISEVMLDKGACPLQMRAHYGNSEVVSSEKAFTLSAGGHYHDKYHMPGSEQENGIPVPTALMLPGDGPLMSQMLRFLGRGDNDRINNTGVFENFACGIRPLVPASWEPELRPAGAWLETGPWTFIARRGVYIALHRQSRPSPHDYAPSVGFAEVVSQHEFPSLAAFRARVLALNPHGYAYYGSNFYHGTRGKTIEFTIADPPQGPQQRPPGPPRIDQWLIHRVWDAQGQPLPLETHLARWPLVEATAMQPSSTGPAYIFRADGSGQVLFNNPDLHQSLLMSLADPAEPIRIEQSGEIVDLGHKASQKVLRQDSTGIDRIFTLPHPQKVRYVSIPWSPGAQPQRVELQLRRASSWQTAKIRSPIFTHTEKPFRTEFDLGPGTPIISLRIIATGRDLKLLSPPEVYLDQSAKSE